MEEKMSAFKEAFDKIGDAIQDIVSLEVVSYKGSINIAAGEAYPKDFETIMEKARASADFKITACTLSQLDGDMQVFYDADITQADIDAHLILVDTARKNRQAMVDLFKGAIGSAVGKIGD
jgi:hypothetical protein